MFILCYVQFLSNKIILKAYGEGIMDKSEVVCTCGELHKGHICYLTNMGMLLEVHHISDKPAVRCEKCGAKANQPHNVCFPGSLTK